MNECGSLQVAVNTAQVTWMAESRKGTIDERTAVQYAKALSTFQMFAEANGILSVRAVDRKLCEAWIHAPLPSANARSRTRAGRSSGASTRRRRQTALRRAAKLWLSLGILVVNPVPGDVIRPEGLATTYPLTPPEVALLRSFGRVGLRDTLRPAMVEAAIAGASQQGIASLVVASFDSGKGALILQGTRQTLGRKLALGSHGVAALSARVSDLTRSAERRGLSFDPTMAPLLIRHSPDSSM